MQLDAVSKNEFWQKHIDQWESSKLNQKSYCAQAEINLTTFVYWRSRLKKPKEKQFTPVTIQPSLTDASIKIKMVTGKIICIPLSVGIPGIAKLIHLLEMPNA